MKEKLSQISMILMKNRLLVFMFKQQKVLLTVELATHYLERCIFRIPSKIFKKTLA